MDTVEPDWDLLKSKFVVDGWDPARISAEFQVKRFLVAQQMAVDKWRDAREEHIKNEVQATAKTLGLEGHINAADHLVYVGKQIAMELAQPGMDLKEMRSKAETYRTTVEAVNIAMRLSRDVRGIRLGQPSSMGTDDRDTQVVYTVRTVREQAPDQGEAVNG